MNTSLAMLWLTLLTQLRAEVLHVFYPHFVQEEFGKIGRIKDGLSPRRRKAKPRVGMGRKRESSASSRSSCFRHQAIGYSFLWYFQIVLKFYQKAICIASSKPLSLFFPV